MMRLLYRPWLSYRDRGLIVRLLWEPVLIVLAIGYVASHVRTDRLAWLVAGVVVFYLAWLGVEGWWRRR